MQPTHFSGYSGAGMLLFLIPENDLTSISFQPQTPDLQASIHSPAAPQRLWFIATLNFILIFKFT
jgi:hypothetical protein